MDTNLDLPKLRGRDSNVPARILLVDDDELGLSLMADRLRAARFSVAVASNGEEALRMLDREWFPVILSDWQMPVMDGIEVIEQLRARGADDSFFIMFTVRADSDDFNRGYNAGVDDYLSKKSTDTEIIARIEAGMNTVALRRALRQARAGLAAVQAQMDAIRTNEREFDERGEKAHAYFKVRAQSELARAKRYGRTCSVLLMGVDSDAEFSAATNNESAFNSAVQAVFEQALHGVVRIDIDLVQLLEADARHVRFGILLPETGPAEVAIIRARVRAALSQTVRQHFALPDGYVVSVGAASFDPNAARLEVKAEEFIAVAESCRKCMVSCGADRLAAVQSSVAKQISIPCRHGYAVADHCLELERRQSSAADSATRVQEAVC